MTHTTQSKSKPVSKRLKTDTHTHKLTHMHAYAHTGTTVRARSVTYPGMELQVPVPVFLLSSANSLTVENCASRQSVPHTRCMPVVTAGRRQTFSDEQRCSSENVAPLRVLLARRTGARMTYHFCVCRGPGFDLFGDSTGVQCTRDSQGFSP